MLVYLAGQDLNFFGEPGQRRGITLRKLFDTSGQCLGYAIQFALHVRRQGSQPFIFHHQRLYFILAKRSVSGSAKMSFRRTFILALVILPFSFFASSSSPPSPPCSSSSSSILRVMASLAASSCSMFC